MADLVIDCLVTYKNDANFKVSLLFLIRVKFLQERRDDVRRFERFDSKNEILFTTALLQKCRNGSFEKSDELSIYKGKYNNSWDFKKQFLYVLLLYEQQPLVLPSASKISISCLKKELM